MSLARGLSVKVRFAWQGWLVAAGFLVVLLLSASCAAAGSSSTPAPVSPTQLPSASPSTPSSPAARQLITVVAAENFYGDLVQQIGGDQVKVTSILKDPSVDPHEYESNVDDAKAVADAQLVIKNGLGYDAFVDKLLGASPRPNRIVIDVGQLTGHKDGDNPHVWYDPSTMPRVAGQLATVLGQLDPAHQDTFSANLEAFRRSEQGVDDETAAIKARYGGAKVLVTEPIFDYMAGALGLEVVDREGAFPRAVEQGNDPPASAVAEFRQQLTSHAVKALIVDSQTVTPITTQMQDLARQNNVAVVPVSETEPEGKSYQQWMLEQLRSLGQALGG